MMVHGALLCMHHSVGCSFFSPSLLASVQCFLNRTLRECSLQKKAIQLKGLSSA